MLGAWLAEHAPDVHFLHETPEILDSGGAVKNALAVLGPGPIFTLNADAVWDGAAPLRVSPRLGGRPNGRAGRACPPRAMRWGGMAAGISRCDGRAHRVGQGARRVVYVGAQILKTDRIAAHPEARFSMVEVWNAMMAEGRLMGHLHSTGAGPMWAIPAGIAAAEAMVGHDAAL
jgi:MurNAc alpha-1-phosphate uridylyltransferase